MSQIQQLFPELSAVGANRKAGRRRLVNTRGRHKENGLVAIRKAPAVKSSPGQRLLWQTDAIDG